MPITVKTVSGPDGTETGYALHSVVLHSVESMAECLGTTYNEVAGLGTTGGYKEVLYYIDMRVIGYQGWCVYFHSHYDASLKYIVETAIVKTKEDGTPNVDDQNKISFVFSGENFAYDKTGRPITCVMIHDESKDTVLFDIHNGETAQGTDLSPSDFQDWSLKWTLFFAKDVKGGVLCGIGNSNIVMIRTVDRKSHDEAKDFLHQKPQKLNGMPNIVCLTKMVNYLDTDYPEMKSAHISVIRPIDSELAKKRAPVYEVNGIRWGTAGNSDWTGDIHGVSGYYCYFPYNPFVKI